jgi:hypothetical protein
LALAEYVTPGMWIYHDDFPSGTVVTSVATGVITVSAASTGTSSGASEEVIFAYDTGDTVTGLGPGYVRTFGNAWPAVLPWRKAYLDRFEPARQSLAMSGANPGHAQNALNSWYVQNRHTGPADFGAFMGFADLGPAALVFYAKGRMRLWNPRTGLTHADDDYTLTSVSWTRGARSPYAICAGNGWVIFLADEGLFVCDAGEGEHLLSKPIYDAEAPVGERGELEYAIAACIAASESRADTYALSAQVHGGVLSVRYAYSATENREIRYDFSASVGRSGLAEVLRGDGSPYPWSCPLTLPVAVSCWVSESDGMHHYAARDTNAGTTDGRVDEIDTGTEDNGEAVIPVAYTGLSTDPGGPKQVVQYLLFVGRKQEAGLKVAVCTDPEMEPTEAEWLDLLLPESGRGEYVRAMLSFPARARHDRSALCYRISDDGSGDCPEISKLVPMIEPQDFK